MGKKKGVKVIFHAALSILVSSTSNGPLRCLNSSVPLVTGKQKFSALIFPFRDRLAMEWHGDVDLKF